MSPTLHPVIMTADPAPLVRFYQHLLGAAETYRFPETGQAFYIRLSLGESALGIVADGRHAQSGDQRLLLSVEVDDLDALLQQVDEAGGTVLGPATDMPWGQRVAHVHDPDGNMVNLTEQL